MENVRYIDSLKNKHVGSDIWVLGSGASLNYVEPSFFENKICILIFLLYPTNAIGGPEKLVAILKT